MSPGFREFIPPLVALSGVAAAFTAAIVLRWTSRRGRKRNPLTRDLLRWPGHTLREEVDEITLDMMADVLCLLVTGHTVNPVHLGYHRSHHGF